MKNQYLASKIYFIIFVILFLLVLFPQYNFAQDSLSVLKIVHLTDPHICNLTGYHPAFISSREHYGNGAGPLAEFLKTQPQKLGVDAVIITGDLIDYFEAETEQGPWLATQTEQVVPILDQCTVPLFLTLGNHDIASYWIKDSTKENFQTNVHQARATWIRNFSCFQKGTYYSRIFPVGKTNYHFLFLDNGYSLGNGAFVDKAQLDWLNFQVKKAGADPVIVFMHKYLPIPDLNGDGIAFKSQSSFVINEKACSQGLLKTLNESENIKALFVGHGHRNVHELIQFPSGNKVLQTETAAFSQDPNNWRRIDFYESKIVVYSGDDKGIEQQVPLN
jgi:3',5'-cyclic AMP phosphodiesterase CpdA